jgi:hypothetical protein
LNKRLEEIDVPNFLETIDLLAPFIEKLVLGRGNIVKLKS